MQGYVSGYQGNFAPAVSAVIPINTQTSATINTGGMALCGVFIPAAFTGTAITFLASHDGTNFVPVKSTTSGSALSYTVAQGQFNAIDPKDFNGIQYLQIKSGSSEAAARTLVASLKGF